MSRKYSLKALRDLVEETPGDLEIRENKGGHIQVYNRGNERIVNWWPNSKKRTAHVDNIDGTKTKGQRNVTAEQIISMALAE